MHKRWTIVLWTLLLLLIVANLVGGRLVELITDGIWFSELGYGEVFRTVLLSELALFFVGGGFAFAFFFVNARLALKNTRGRPAALPGPQGSKDSVILNLPEQRLNQGAWAAGLLVALLMGFFSLPHWDEVQLALHTKWLGVKDPILGRDVAFYMFLMPLVPWLKGLLWTTGVITAGAMVGTYLVRRPLVAMFMTAPVVQGARQSMKERAVRHHLALLLGYFVLLLAAGFFLDRHASLFSQQGPFAGPGYADAHARLPLLALTSVACLLGGAVAVVGLWRGRLRLMLIAAAAVGVAWLLLLVVPPLVQRLMVDPNELERERPFLAHHIEATNRAFGLDRLVEHPLPGDASLDRATLDEHQPTLNNVPLWDEGPLLETFEQLQEIRTYYEFVSVDNDRYTIDGELRQTMLSPRELLTDSLPNRTWVNEKLTFTHGYGLTLGPVNQVTPEGLPKLLIKDLPPSSQVDRLQIERPEIYYGEVLSNHVFVNSQTEEFDYPAGEENIFARYQGEGGFPTGGLLRRLLLALRFGSIKVLFTDDFGEGTRVLMYRHVRERVSRLAPFLRYDRDPYMVIDGGRLYWVLDAYTASVHYPYSQAVGRSGNYMRNPVKVVVDAYDGKVTFYRLDQEEPLISAWAKVFPSLLRPVKEMPAGLRAHLRHPLDLFTVQAHVYGTYHMREPAIFYNKEDQWEVPVVDDVPMKPHYIVLRLPGEPKEEFILMLPFTPRRKDNLAAWMVARCDGEHLGQLVAYRFPKHKLIFGPRQVVARINQNAEISRQVSLWDQRGSTVVWGTLQVIPIDQSLLYIRPLYLKADSGRIPELKRVVVGYQSSIAMEPTLEQALIRIFGKPGAPGPVVGDLQVEQPRPDAGDDQADALSGQAAAPSASGGVGARAPASSGSQATPEVRAGARRAWQLYQSATAAARQGDWATYGQDIRQLGDIIRELAAADESAAPDTPGRTEANSPALPGGEAPPD